MFRTLTIFACAFLIVSPFVFGAGFPALHSYWVGDDPTIAAAGGDLNNDGKNDLIVANNCILKNACKHGALHVLLGKGDGTFNLATSIPLQSLPSHLIVADFDGDGRLDVVVAGTYFGKGVLEERLGKGDGTFGPPSLFPTLLDMGLPNSISQPFRAVDLNGDGKLDIVGTIGQNEIAVLPGNGDGTFGQPQITTLPNRVIGDNLAIGDFDKDGKLDLALSLSGVSPRGALFVALGNGDGTFRLLSPSASDVPLHRILPADFDGDGVLDLVVEGDTALLLFHGNGDGTFQVTRKFSPAGVPGAFLVTVDMDGNGKPDILLGDGAKLTILLNSGSTNAPNTLYYSLGIGIKAASAYQGPASVVVQDLNGDGLPDAIAVGASAVVALGTGGGMLAAPRQFRTSQFTTSIAVGDFNDDNHPDVATAHLFGSLFTTMGFGDGIFGAFRRAGATDSHSPCCLSLGDFDNDGRLDVLVTGGVLAPASNFLGNGDRTFRRIVENNLPPGLANSVVGDFNGDGKLDIVIALDTGGAQLMFGNGDGTFLAGPVFAQTGRGRLAAADLDRSGTLDLVFGSSVYLGNGDGTFQTMPLTFGGNASAAITTFDVNGDTLLDILTVDQSGLSVFLGNGDGTFQAALNTPFATSSFKLVVADFNGDKKPDVAAIMNIGNTFPPAPVTCILFGRGDGTFRSPTPLRSGGSTLDFAVGDMNRDGTPDLVVTDGSDRFTVLLNQR